MLFYSKFKKKKGFTLIELLVVISIIGLLSSVVLASLNSARGKARDAKRKSDLKELEKALALYYEDNNETYPRTEEYYWTGETACSGNWPNKGQNGWIPGLVPKYLPRLPLDPVPGPDKCYLYKSDGTYFRLLAYRTVEVDLPSSGSYLYDPKYNPSTNSPTYSVRSPATPPSGWANTW